MDQVGDLVAIRSTSNGSIRVWRANPAIRIRMPVAGVIIKKWGATDCIVQFHGPVLNVYTDLLPTCVYTVGDDGKPAATPLAPELPDGTRYIQHTARTIDTAATGLAAWSRIALPCHSVSPMTE
jgi:hypothetical protein